MATETLNPEILVVSEQEEHLAQLRSAISTCDASLIEARSGAEGLALLSAHKVFMILIDVEMGGMDGYVTATLIRSDSQYQDVPIIFLLPENEAFKHEDKGYETGLVDSLNYPIDPHALKWKTKVFLELYCRQKKLFDVVAQLEYEVVEHKQTKEKREKLEAQLRQSQKMETIGTLAGGIAHDFNNILGTILGFTDLMLLSTPTENENHGRLAHVKRAAERASNLVKQILTFSRQSEQQKVAIEFQTILDEAVTLLRSTIPSSVQIQTDIIETPAIVTGDPTQLEQIILNLCKNASDAFDHEEGMIQIRLREIDSDKLPQDRETEQLSPGKYLQLDIQDNGCGMDATTRNRAFEPFYTTKDVNAGTGLGLSVVHGIVKEHKGEIIIKSTVGAGSTFSVYLPISAPQEPIPIKQTSAIPRGNENILLVDDDKALSTTIELILQSLGYTVTVKNESLEAAALLKKQDTHFDLMITDYTMPDLTGIELINIAKKFHPNLPVIMISGYNQRVAPANYSQFGIQSYLSKPFNMAEISNAIVEVVEKNAINA